MGARFIAGRRRASAANGTGATIPSPLPARRQLRARPPRAAHDASSAPAPSAQQPNRNRSPAPRSAAKATALRPKSTRREDARVAGRRSRSADGRGGAAGADTLHPARRARAKHSTLSDSRRMTRRAADISSAARSPHLAVAVTLDVGTPCHAARRARLAVVAPGRPWWRAEAPQAFAGPPQEASTDTRARVARRSAPAAGHGGRHLGSLLITTSQHPARRPRMPVVCRRLSRGCGVLQNRHLRVAARNPRRVVLRALSIPPVWFRIGQAAVWRRSAGTASLRVQVRMRETFGGTRVPIIIQRMDASHLTPTILSEQGLPRFTEFTDRTDQIFGSQSLSSSVLRDIRVERCLLVQPRRPPDPRLDARISAMLPLKYCST